MWTTWGNKYKKDKKSVNKYFKKSVFFSLEIGSIYLKTLYL